MKKKPDAKDIVLRMKLPLEASAAGVHTYWHSNGEYQGLYDRLYAMLVPEKGESDYPHGEFLRHGCNVYYDVYNNGGCNFDCGRRVDLVDFLDTLEEHAFPKIAEMRVMFGPFLSNEPEKDEDAPRIPKDFGRHIVPLLEEAMDFTILKVDELSRKYLKHD